MKDEIFLDVSYKRNAFSEADNDHRKSSGDTPQMKRRGKNNEITSETVALLREGNIDAFNEVFFSFGPAVMRFLTALTGSSDDAEEICQEVFVKLWLGHANIDPEKGIKAYLYTIARNESFDYFRRKRKVSDSHREIAFDVEEFSSDQDVLVRETELLIRLAVNRMPEQRRRVFELSRYEGMTNDEIAAALHLRKNTVERHISFALKDIRKLLGVFISLFFVS